MSRADAVHRGGSEVIVFGRRAVLEAIAEPRVEVGEIRVARGCPALFRGELAAACRRHGRPAPETADAAAVRALSGEPRHDQGVAARIRLSLVSDAEAFVAGLTGQAAKRPARMLALDGVTNPQNIGMIVRSAVASGVGGMLWPRVGCPWISGLIIKASAATIYRCSVAACHTLPEGLWALKRAGFTLCGLAANGATSLFDFVPPHRSAFILGGETGGISGEVNDLLDERLSIPMANGVESLNVAVAAGLVCFHVMRDAVRLR